MHRFPKHMLPLHGPKRLTDRVILAPVNSNASNTNLNIQQLVPANVKVHKPAGKSGHVNEFKHCDK